MSTFGKDKPDFLIIGSMKSGTTTLYDDLSNFPDVFMPIDKEPEILLHSTSAVEMRREYSHLFYNAEPGQLCGEASTGYTWRPYFEGVAERASSLCGSNLRLIMIMRDPYERIISHLRHDIAGGHIEFEDIDRIVLEEPRYVDVSNYAMQLEPWVVNFGPENLYCVGFEEFRSNRARVVANIRHFLGLPALDIELNTTLVSNRSSELQRTGKVIGGLLRSRIYRNVLRKAMPRSTRDLARMMLLRSSSVPEISLSEATRKELKHRLSGVESALEKLVGKRITIHAEKS